MEPEDYLNLFKSHGFRVETKNGGIQLVVHIQKKTVDFWPTTSKFFVREDKFRGETFELLTSHFNLNLKALKTQTRKKEKKRKALAPAKAPTKEINAGNLDLCLYCPNESEVGAHGVSDGVVYSKHFCMKCFNLIHKGKATE